MAAATKRSMSDIRPVSRKAATEPKPVALKSEPKPKPAAKVVAPQPITEPQLEVERFKELEAPKRRSKVWTFLALLILVLAAAGATYWVYITYIVQ